MSSSVTVQRQPAAPAKSRGKSFALVGAGALILILGVVAVGGFLAFKWYGNKPDVNANGTTAGTGTTAGASTNATTEFGRYWLEVLPNASVAEPTRVADSLRLKSGQAFKFHFQTRENGYLYIVGPGEGSKPTAFLTEKPAALSGLDSNQVTKESDFSFPNGLERWLELDKKPGTEDYTIIFSPQPLTSPAFLRNEATGNALSETERAQFDDFITRYKIGTPVRDVDNQDANGPSMVVKVPQPKEPGAPVVFDVRIKHQ
jgi:hypothetical protein